MFDEIVKEARKKFNLGNKADGLLSTLLALMMNRETGGFRGFLDHFNEVGLNDTAASWIGSGTNTPISSEQVESVFGDETLKDISANVGLDYQKTVSATAFMTPRIVDKLTPEGIIPAETDLLSQISAAGAIGTTGAFANDTIDRVGTAAGATIDAKNPFGNTVDRVDPAAELVGTNFENSLNNADDSDTAEDSVLRWLLPLLLLGLLVIMGFWFCGKSSPMTAINVNKNTNKTNTNNNKISVKAIDSSLNLEAENGKYIVSGNVADEAARKQIVDALTAQYGAENVNFDNLKIVAGAKSFGANWWNNFGKLLPNLKDWKTGELSFVGNAITVVASLPEAAIEQIKTIFIGWKLPLSIAGEAGATKQANEEALKNLSEAKTAQEVVDALNISIIQFDSGKSDVKSEFQPLLQKAAEILKAQPADTNIEIGGHTDNVGNENSNMTLSQERAASVKNELVKLGVKNEMLTVKGYGDTVPKADNGTKEGQFTNRRIEYKVISGSGNLTESSNSSVENSGK